MKNLLAKFRRILSVLTILLAGPLVARLPYVTLFLQEFAERFGLFLALVLIWELILWFITRFILSPKTAPSKYMKVFCWGIAFLMSAALLSTLTHFEEKVSSEFFLGFIALLGVRGLLQGLSLVGYDRLVLCAKFLYLFGLANVSGAIAVVGWQWPFLVISLALQSGILAAYCIEKLRVTLLLQEKQPQPALAMEITRYSRLHAFALLLGPILICALHYAGALPKSYLLTLAALGFMVRSAEVSRTIEKGTRGVDAMPQIELWSSLSTITFISCFIAAAFFDF